MTLAELILSMFLLTLLIVIVLGVFTTYLSAGVKSSDQAIGVMFAEQVLERVNSSAKITYPAFPAAFNGGQGIYTQDPTNQTTFFYDVTASELTPAVNANPLSAGESWLLETRVSWWSNAAGASRTGYGALSVRRARMVYVSR